MKEVRGWEEKSFHYNRFLMVTTPSLGEALQGPRRCIDQMHVTSWGWEYLLGEERDPAQPLSPLAALSWKSATFSSCLPSPQVE